MIQVSRGNLHLEEGRLFPVRGQITFNLRRGHFVNANYGRRFYPTFYADLRVELVFVFNACQ